MVISLRRRPVCHYCGKRNSPVNAQKFKCKHCLADNFLDENGEITDVPIGLTQASERYATPLEPFDSSQSIFCSICVKNQNLYTDAMSHYLPEFDHPEYDKFEAAYPEFKRRMEKQYPQCCVKCEPKVQAQLQQATYNAKSDHVRRLLERSRSKLGYTTGWRSVVVNGAGLGYIVSLIIQLVWHVMGSQATTIEIPFMRPTDCFTGRPAAQCPDMIEQFMGLSLLLGAIFGWWNPKWQHKLKRRPGRLVGLSGYYQAQAAVLVIRFAAWVALRDLPALKQHRPMLHSLSLVLIALIAGYTNMAIIKVDTTPLVDWKQKQVPLLTEGQFEAPVQPQGNHQNDLLQNLQPTQSRLEPWRPPTPPIDEMDWAPSPANFIPQPKKIVYKSTQPSPFVGTVPALPKQGIYASRAKDQPEPAKAIGIPQGFFDKRDHLKEVKTGDPVFAQPKFFAHNSDTGLESIFGKVFSLDEDAVEVRNQPQMEQTYPGTVSTTEIWLRGFAIVALGMMTVHAIASNYLGFEPKFNVVVGAVLVPMSNIFYEVTHDMNRSRILLGLMDVLLLQDCSSAPLESCRCCLHCGISSLLVQ